MRFDRPFITLSLLASSLLAQAAAPGYILLASGEGISVFDRSGTMSFGKFVVPAVDGKGGPTEWSDIVYDGWRLPSGNSADGRK